MRVLLTGATRFIGSHVTRIVLGEADRVTVTVRRGSDRSRLREVLGKVELLEMDLSDRDADQ
ncbi:MAG: hypothetical protein AUH85_14025 [Chloroflexi bacterium 13_1_40CM_4_68_4]|nr:MAG: hypothetical protein AUH85_14025 [Chloroflexi bacterium 13_1_40CM_4_68_4]